MPFGISNKKFLHVQSNHSSSQSVFNMVSNNCNHRRNLRCIVLYHQHFIFAEGYFVFGHPVEEVAFDVNIILF